MWKGNYVFWHNVSWKCHIDDILIFNRKRAKDLADETWSK